MREESPHPQHADYNLFSSYFPQNWVPHSTSTIPANLPFPVTLRACSHLGAFAHAVSSAWKALPPGYYGTRHSLAPLCTSSLQVCLVFEDPTLNQPPTTPRLSWVSHTTWPGVQHPPGCGSLALSICLSPFPLVLLGRMPFRK